jgi:hypothetical protein
MRSGTECYGLGISHRKQVEAMLRKVDLVELTPLALERALQPFQVLVRTLDSLHLATMDFLRRRGATVEADQL